MGISFSSPKLYYRLSSRISRISLVEESGILLDMAALAIFATGLIIARRKSPIHYDKVIMDWRTKSHP